MNEKDEAIVLASRVLDRINADPDDDLAILARQFLRVQDKYNALAGRDNSVMDAALLERTEACAKLCEEKVRGRAPVRIYVPDGGGIMRWRTARECAAAIRALLKP